MKDDHNPKLRQVLQAWQVTPPCAPDFKTNVWRRIAVEEARAARTFGMRLREWFLIELPKPAYATALLALAIMGSVTAANLRATQVREEQRVTDAREYLASIDPIAMSMRGMHPSQ